MTIFSFSFHRDCASKVMRKDWQAQESVRFALSSVKHISRMKLDQEMNLRNALLNQKSQRAHISILSCGPESTYQGSNFELY